MFKTNRETGQTIVLIAVMIFGLFVLAALIVDGGNMYLNRRQAQTAADAAALAAVHELCVNKGTLIDADLVATEYALNKNRATHMVDLSPGDGGSPFILIDSETKSLQVAVGLTHSTFFARVFGRPTTTVEADASAGCYPPGAVDQVIPIAWSCRPPVGEVSDSDVCDWKSIPWNVMKDIINDDTFVPEGAAGTLLYHDDSESTGEAESASEYLDQDSLNETLQLYIVMDSLPLAKDLGCQVETEIVNGVETIVASYCDLDGDGRFDVTTSKRSWLILDHTLPGGGLDDIVLGQVELGIDLPTWFPGRSGEITDVYKDAESADGIEGKPALIPVFQEFCSPTPHPGFDPLCDSMYVEGDKVEVACEDDDPPDPIKCMQGSKETFFRVVSFAEFYVTCITFQKDCPGQTYYLNWLQDLKAAGTITAQEYSQLKGQRTIEGYFINGWADGTMDIGSNEIDLGVYVLSLIE